MTPERRARSLTPTQRARLDIYDKRHREMMGDSLKLRNWENLLGLFEDYLHLCKCLNIPIEPQIQALKQSWKNNISNDPSDLDQFEDTLRQLARLRDEYE